MTEDSPFSSSDEDPSEPIGPAETRLADLVADERHHPRPPQAGAIGMGLFLASLTMLFVAGMLVYLLIRLGGTNAPEMGTIHVPHILILSTLIILVSSVTMHAAVRAVQRERQVRMRQMLVATLALSLGFILVQAPGLFSLAQAYGPKHEAFEVARATAVAEANRPGPALNNQDIQADFPQEMHVLFLIVVHALHVIGGIIPLFVITLNAHQGHYDHEAYGPVRYTAWYWHFLDVVWCVMFALIWFTA